MASPSYLSDPAAFALSIISGTSGLEPGPLMGLDPGTKTIGFALSDAGWTLASPVATHHRRKMLGDVEAIKTIIEQEKVSGLVIGMPLNMDGSIGPRAQSVRAFRRSLADHINCPMLFWDERLSTEAAREGLKHQRAFLSHAQATIDAVAAAHILGQSLPILLSERQKLGSLGT